MESNFIYKIEMGILKPEARNYLPNWVEIQESRPGEIHHHQVALPVLEPKLGGTSGVAKIGQLFFSSNHITVRNKAGI